MPTKKKSPKLPAPSRSGVKRGPLSKQERLYIEEHRETMKPEAIALHLNRPINAVQNYIEASEGVPIARRTTIAEAFKRSPEWARYQEEFTASELKYFEHKYVQLMSQFQDDVHSSEETQICQAITLDILIHRVMKEQKQAIETMERIQKDLSPLYQERESLQEGGDKTELNKVAGRIMMLEESFAGAHASVKALSQRHENLLAKHQAITKDIKGTRDQRVKVFENSKQSFLGLLRSLRDEQFRKLVGEEAEMVRLATIEERKRLSQPHKFEDGVEDPPYLVPQEQDPHSDSDVLS